MPGYIFILVLLVLLWFLLIRPQRRRQLEAQRMLEQLNQPAQLHGLGFAKIDYFERASIIIDPRHQAGDNVVDVGVIATSGPVTKHGNH